MAEVWSLARKVGSGFLRSKTGILCPICKAELRIFQTRSQIAVVVAVVAVFGVFMLAVSAVPKNSDLFAPMVGAFVIIVGFVTSGGFARRFAFLRPREDGEVLDFPVERFKQEAEKARLDAEELYLDPPKPGPAWTCARCEEQNPGTFMICWKCQQAKDGGI